MHPWFTPCGVVWGPRLRAWENVIQEGFLFPAGWSEPRSSRSGFLEIFFYPDTPRALKAPEIRQLTLGVLSY